MVEFARKYDYLFRRPAQSVFLTDHKPLTTFLDSSAMEGIYCRWVSELRLLNIRIEYIPGKRSCVADALSRTIFPGRNCKDSFQHLGTISETRMAQNGDLKDGKGGYDES
jgi:hypothetical protein